MTRRSMPWLVALLALSASWTAADEKKPKDSKPAPTREELEKQFAQTMSGATLVGHFTLTGQKSDQPLKEDRYHLGKVTKRDNDDWIIPVRIVYDGHDLTIPLTLPVKWAGDTPVICVSDVLVPGLGTYSARVLVYGDQYAGTWSGGDHGGQMFGKIVKEGEDKEQAKH